MPPRDETAFILNYEDMRLRAFGASNTPPVLIAMGAEATLRKGGARRALPQEAFFIDYGRQDREAGEFAESIRIPRANGALHAAYKISKRRDEDISSVAAGFNVTVEDGAITAVRIAYGGMAGTPKRAEHAEAALLAVDRLQGRAA